MGVQMNMPDSLRKDILNDIYQARKVEKTLRNLMNSTVTGYNPFKLEFDWAAPFVPSCAEFMELNRDLVRQHFPEVDTCQCSAFIVEKGTNAYGFHSASAAGYEFGYLFNNGVLAPEYQMSFHTAVSATNLSSNPFTIFDEVTPELFNNHFLAQHFRTMEPSLAADTMMLVRAAVVMYEEQSSITHLRVFQDYLHAMYYATTQCGSTASKAPGSYWALEPGQALYFNNWRVHGDSGLGSSEYDRVTMDLRCFSETKVPTAFADSYDWTRRLSPHMVNTYEKAAECLLKLFNYSSADEFLKVVFGRDMPNGVSYYAGVGNLGLNDTGVHSLMHENSLDGMRRHSALVREAYANDSLNYDAFTSCYQDHVVAFDERFKDAPLPWSLADRVLTFPKLYFAFAPMQFHVIVVFALFFVLWYIRRRSRTISTRCEQVRKPGEDLQKLKCM